MSRPLASLCSLAFGAAALFGFSSCTSYTVPLTYKPPANGQRIARGNPVVDVARVNDLRDVKGSEIGSIRNEVGIPIKVLHAGRPISQITHNAFEYGLDVRGMLNNRNPSHTITADVLELWCHQYTSQDAGARIRVTINRRGSSQPVFSKTYYAKRSNPTASVSYWSSVEEVASVTSAALQATIDGAIDDPEFRRALRR